MDATLILIDSDAELARASYGIRIIRPTSLGWRRKCA